MPADQLLALQRQVLAALREPLRGDSRARTALPARPGDVSPAFVTTATDLLTPSAALEPVARLELYHRQYWYRLLDSLAEDFPAVRHLLGEAAFWTLLERYLEATAPRAFSLRALGAGLAAYVARHATAIPHAPHVEDLARLEYAWLAAFDAAARPAAPAEELAAMSIALQPHLTLLACRTPADTVWRRALDGRPRRRLAPAREAAQRFVAVSRDGLQRRVERLHPAAHALLAAVAATGSLERALDTAAPLLPSRGGRALIASWFEDWTRRAWFVMPGQVA